MKKCIRCNKKYEHTISYKGKNYCVTCLYDFKETKTNCSVCKKSMVRDVEYSNDTMEKADTKKYFCSSTCYQQLIQDRQDLDELDRWLKSYHKVEKLNSRIYMQIQQFKSKNNFTTKGILLTLQYITNTLKKNLEPDTIGIVSWYYDTAKQEYINRFNRQQNALHQEHNGIDLSVSKKVMYKPIIDNRKKQILITDIDFEGGFDDV